MYKEQGGAGQIKVIGVRAEESSRRARIWKQIVDHKKSGKIVCPIIYWTSDDVWEFHRQEGLPYCCLYDEGFTRLGCVGCPMAGPKVQAMEFARWPNYERNWKRAFKMFWEKWSGVPTLKGERRWFEDFGSWEGLWSWWISGKAAEGGTGCQLEFLFT